MKAIIPYTQIFQDFDGEKVLKKIELCGRTCYQSEHKITDDSAAPFVRGLIHRGHEAMLEHQSVTVKFVVDRGISHEIVRHRLSSFAQESTRYCNYSSKDDDYEGQLTFILPCFLKYGTPAWKTWQAEMSSIEATYFGLLEEGLSKEEARSVLPNSLKTEIVMTANLREWRHFFKLRAAGTTGRPHIQMLEVTIPLLQNMKKMIPVVFDDIEPMKGYEYFYEQEAKTDDEETGD
jgi:thymidylate synthase (FAD)